LEAAGADVCLASFDFEIGEENVALDDPSDLSDDAFDDAFPSADLVLLNM